MRQRRYEMTNNEKIQNIIAYLGNRTMATDDRLREQGLCSAEWIYAKAQRDCLISVLERIEKIANEK